MRRAAGLAILLAVTMAAEAALAAHMPYVKPTTFAPRRDFITFEAAMSADVFFAPDFPIRGDGDFWATGPSGVPVKAVAATVHKEFAVAEAALPGPGTYRLSTGDRPGRSSKWARIDGEWTMIRPAGAPGASRGIEESAVPAGAETMVAQSYIRAETYVTRGAPDRGALKPSGQGVEIEPLTHPNELFVGEAFRFKLLSDGGPAAEAPFAIYRSGDVHAERRYTFAGKTDAAGAASVTFDQAGIYVLIASYPPRTPGSNVPLPRTTTYSLTFEVTR